MGFKITDSVQYFDFRAPNKRVAMIEIHYTTDKGFSGVVRLEQATATQDSIVAAIKSDSALPDSLIGAYVGK